MEQLTLLWVDMGCEAGSDPASAQFAPFCHIQPVDRHHLHAAASMATASHVICLDYAHPDIDGLKFAADTKTRFPSVPIVMLTAQRSADIVLWALRTRMFDVIVKPLVARDVHHCMERLTPIIAARRIQSTRRNATGAESIPQEARYRVRDAARHKLRQVSEYIAKNHLEPIRESAMARLCGMSPFRFSRAFHETYGVTFRDYVCEYRLNQAKRLLENRNVSVTDVAAMAGFNDPSYFARLFRKRTGISPTAYRAALVRPEEESAAAEEKDKAHG